MACTCGRELQHRLVSQMYQLPRSFPSKVPSCIPTENFSKIHSSGPPSIFHGTCTLETSLQDVEDRSSLVNGGGCGM